MEINSQAGGYAALCENFRWQIPAKFNIAVDVCGRWADERSRFALYYEDESGFTSAHSFWDIQREANRLANVLAALGTLPGDRVAILLPQCPETAIAHVAIYQMGALAVPLSHLFGPDALEYRLGDSGAHVAIVDETSLPKVQQLRQKLPQLRHVIGVGAALGAGVKQWAEVLEHASPRYAPMHTAADDPAMIIYTSGTTGNPKAALYSHRSTMLHAFAGALPDALNMSARDAVLPVVPMFHVNAWGLPYSAAMTGCKMVFPGPAMDGKSIFELIESEKVSFAAGVPTVWQMMLSHMAANDLTFSTLKRTVIGGSACPPAMITAFNDQYGVEVLHAWGMTEMSPLGTVCTLKNKHQALSSEDKMKVRLKQGRAIFGVDMKIVDPDGKEQPWDGKAFGDLLVKGPWIIADYFKAEGGSPLVDGWFPTGDVATIDPDGYMQITDRSKDVIKSGGEWISSIDVVNIAVAHPAVAMAACIGVKHPKWDERPIIAVVRKPGATVTREELLAFYEGKIAKWQVPDDVVFVEEIPHTATGKIQKTTLREQFRGYALPSA